MTSSPNSMFTILGGLALVIQTAVALCPEGWETAKATLEANTAKFTPLPCYEYSATFNSLGASGTKLITVKDGVALDGERSIEDYMGLIASLCYEDCPDADASCRIQYYGGGYPYDILIDADKSTLGEEIKVVIKDYAAVECPSEEPSSTPVVPPTGAPVVPPTGAPVPPPTGTPVAAPVEAPVAAPVAAPIDDVSTVDPMVSNSERDTSSVEARSFGFLIVTVGCVLCTLFL